MSHPLFDLSGKVALVSGAASGMGRATSIGVAEAGADLMLADINEEGMKDTVREIERLGRRAEPVVCDVSNGAQIRAMFAKLDESYGRIDVLANIAGEGGINELPLEITEAGLIQTLNVLVVGRYVCCQEGARRMIEAGRGSIFNIVSIAGLSALGRGHMAYSIAMGGVAQMTREMSTEWSGKGVRVNAIVCAQIMNEGLRKRIDADSKLGDTYLRGIPIGRLGEPIDIAYGALYLASDEASFVTGIQLVIDGGTQA